MSVTLTKQSSGLAKSNPVFRKRFGSERGSSMLAWYVD